MSLLTGALLTWVLLVGLAACRLVVTLWPGMHGNGYGLCSGLTMASTPGISSATPAPTDCLTAYFDELAGVSGRAHPLTFDDMWGGPNRHAPGAVAVEVMTSAVSQQMNYGIPHSPSTSSPSTPTSRSQRP
jgi:hypothetical protein